MPCEAIVTGLPAAPGARWHAAKFVLPRWGAVVEPLEICHGGVGVLDTGDAGHVVIPTASTGVIFATGSGPFHHLLTLISASKMSKGGPIWGSSSHIYIYILEQKTIQLKLETHFSYGTSTFSFSNRGHPKTLQHFPQYLIAIGGSPLFCPMVSSPFLFGYYDVCSFKTTFPIPRSSNQNLSSMWCIYIYIIDIISYTPHYIYICILDKINHESIESIESKFRGFWIPVTVGILREVQRTALCPPRRDLHGGPLAAQEMGPVGRRGGLRNGGPNGPKGPKGERHGKNLSWWAWNAWNAWKIGKSWVNMNESEFKAKWC